ncbi:hypothetical protein CsSME_00028044 [Camellia sinensis var. sinensis]
MEASGDWRLWWRAAIGDSGGERRSTIGDSGGAQRSKHRFEVIRASDL